MRAGRGANKGTPTNHSRDLTYLRKAVWGRDPGNPCPVMRWAACCVNFFGFLRLGELTVADTGEFDPGQHLAVADIMVDNPS